MPTSSDGMIINSSQQLLLGKEQEMNSSNKVVLSFKTGKGPDKEKKITFHDFVLSNKFPNNVSLMKNGNVVVCTDFIENPPESKVSLITGSNFSLKEDAFHYPYASSTYGTSSVFVTYNVVQQFQTLSWLYRCTNQHHHKKGFPFHQQVFFCNNISFIFYSSVILQFHN